MRFKFLHTGDIHLGYRQYNLQQRYYDFARAFRSVVDIANEEEVDFVLIAGDLFHNKTLGPETLTQARKVLERFKAPVFAILGNHDRESLRYRNLWSWPLYLHEEGCLNLLTLSEEGFAGGDGVLEGVRLCGVPYLGAGTPKYLPEMARHLEKGTDKAEYTIFMMHAGIEGVLPRDSFDTLTLDQLETIRPHVDYLALGHIHKAYERDGWVFNPGSLEACSIVEARWRRGVYIVEVDTDAEQKHTVRLVSPSYRRPFHLFDVDVTSCRKAEDVYEKVNSTISGKYSDKQSPAPVVQVALIGELHFRWGDIALERIESIVEASYVTPPLIVRIVDQTSRIDNQGAQLLDMSLTREEIEADIFTRFAQENATYASHSALWAQVMIEVKEMALRGESETRIAEYIRGRAVEGRANGEIVTN